MSLASGSMMAKVPVSDLRPMRSPTFPWALVTISMAWPLPSTSRIMAWCLPVTKKRRSFSASLGLRNERIWKTGKDPPYPVLRWYDSIFVEALLNYTYIKISEGMPVSYLKNFMTSTLPLIWKFLTGRRPSGVTNRISTMLFLASTKFRSSGPVKLPF